jgi:CHAD domain-containing protein
MLKGSEGTTVRNGTTRRAANSRAALVKGLSRALRRNAAVLEAELDLAGQGDSKAIHRARVASRRLREALAVVAAVGSEDAKALRNELRAITAALGPVREMDVSRRDLLNLADQEAWPADAVAMVEEHCDDRRLRDLDRAAKTLEDVDVKSLALRLRRIARAVQRESRGDVADALSRRLNSRNRAFATKVRDVGIVYATDRLHAVRIAAKKLRYVTELADGSAVEGLRRLKRLQKVLGHLHDDQMVQTRIEEIAATEKSLGLLHAFSRMRGDIDTHCRAWHARALPLMLSPRTLQRPARMTPAKRRRTA